MRPLWLRVVLSRFSASCGARAGGGMEMARWLYWHFGRASAAVLCRSRAGLDAYLDTVNPTVGYGDLEPWSGVFYELPHEVNREGGTGRAANFLRGHL